MKSKILQKTLFSKKYSEIELYNTLKKPWEKSFNKASRLFHKAFEGHWLYNDYREVNFVRSHFQSDGICAGVKYGKGWNNPQWITDLNTQCTKNLYNLIWKDKEVLKQSKIIAECEEHFAEYRRVLFDLFEKGLLDKDLLP